MTTRSIIKRILREEKLYLRVKRRLDLIDKEFNRLMRDVYTPNKVCMYTSGEELLMVVVEAVIENIYWSNTFSVSDDTSLEWEKISDSIVGYIQQKYGKKIEEYYIINCGN